MKCNKCGTELTNQDKFCPKCGAEIVTAEKKETADSEKQQTSKKLPKLLQNKKRNIIILAVVVFLILCAIFKYRILLPAILIAVLVAVIMINRKILSKRSKKNTQEVTQYTLKNNEINKLTQYFVSRDEKYISSLGNGYIMNYLVNGSLSAGFAVVSDKRVYFRGSCFSGQGKSLHRTDEERTVDIQDVTGSGFIYRTYVGVLIGLFTALLALVIGFGSTASMALVNWVATMRLQKEADYYQDALDSVDSEKRMTEIEEQLASNAEKLAELEALQVQEIIDHADDYISASDFLYDTEINAAYEEYLNQLHIIFEESNVNSVLTKLQQAAIQVVDYGARYDDEQTARGQAIIDVLGTDHFHLSYSEPTGNDLIYYYTTAESLYSESDNYTPSLYINPYVYLVLVLEYPYSVVENAYTLDGLMNDQLLASTDWNLVAQGTLDKYWYLPTYWEELSPAFEQAYMDFMNVIAPDYAANQTFSSFNEPSLEEIAMSYLNSHPDASFAYITDTKGTSGISTENNTEITEIKEKISNIEAENTALEKEYTDLNRLMSEREDYKQNYEDAQHESSGTFVMAALSTAAAGLLVTFVISCFLVILDYASKRKTMFQIQYAGGSIAFDVSYYAKAEIEDFQKQLRRAKDLSEQSKITNAADIAAQLQQVSNTKAQSPSDELRKYAELLKDGLITQDEYDAMKKKVLGL